MGYPAEQQGRISSNREYGNAHVLARRKFFQYVKVAFFVNYGLVPHSQCVLYPPLNYSEQKSPVTLIGNVLDVNLKLHNSEIGPSLLQKRKILF
jgi:hypothetical protein